LIRVAIFADTLAHAQALAALLAEDDRLEIVETRAWFRSPRPLQSLTADVILAVGVSLQEQRINGPPIVLVSSEPPRQGAFSRAIRAWLPKEASPAEIAAATMAAAQDLTALTQTQVRLWFRAPESIDSEQTAILEALTPRERQVLRMMADGLGNKQIAAQLAISDHTAKFHVAQVLAKLGAASRAEAVAIGIRRGLVPI
jgi:DNA-binding NarL/FixJ family response regulator